MRTETTILDNTIREDNDVDFMEAVKSFLAKTEELDKNLARTEKGAIGYKSIKPDGDIFDALVELNYRIPSLRAEDNTVRVIDRFDKIYKKNEMYFILYLFYLRDILEGLGERRLFRLMYLRFTILDAERSKDLLKYIPTYGRWDDLLYITYFTGRTEVREEGIRIVKEQLSKDMVNQGLGKSISLLAKWLPSENASSKETKSMAKFFRCQLYGTKDKASETYRKVLSSLRRYLDIVETKVTKKDYSNIKYENVPAKANLKYDMAFLRNDTYRRMEHYKKTLNGDSKINVKGLTPGDVVHNYLESRMKAKEYEWKLLSSNLPPFNLIPFIEDSANATWKELSNSYTNDIGLDNCICVLDTSGSMNTTVNNSKLTAREIASGLAMMLAEKLEGPFKDKIITFSTRPTFIDLSGKKTMTDKYKHILNYIIVEETNIEAVFKLILNTAVEMECAPNQMPKQICILSDMEFDDYSVDDYHSGITDPDTPLFKQIEAEYAAKGYKLPKLIFWNIASRTNVLPMIENDNGLALISGYSFNAVKATTKLTPQESLKKVLLSERYEPIIKYLYENMPDK